MKPTYWFVVLILQGLILAWNIGEMRREYKHGFELFQTKLDPHCFRQAEPKLERQNLQEP